MGGFTMAPSRLFILEGKAMATPASSIMTFFPPCDATTSTLQQWTECLAASQARTRLRAWSRVPSTSRTAHNTSGIIMKRVGLPTRRTQQSLLAESKSKETEAKSPQIDRRVRRRLDTYVADDELVKTSENKPSKLDIAGMKMQAKADVALCIQSLPTRLTLHQLQQSRRGHFVQVVPAKRRQDALAEGGNLLTTYIHCKTTGIAAPKHVFATPARKIVTDLSSFRRESSKSPILSARPILSPAGISQHGSPANMLLSPNTASNTKSPTKKEAKAASPIKARSRRISETVVELLPAAGQAVVEPSPIKASSPPPGTPLSERHLQTPSSYTKAKLSPVHLGASTPCPQSNELPSSVTQLSPSKRSPAAVVPTPSKTIVQPPPPSTPRTFITQTNDDTLSPLGFLSSLFASPLPASPVMKLSTPNKTPSFNFGTTSPSFNSVSWLNPAGVNDQQQQPARKVKKASRRLSEPLIRNCFRTSVRRQSMSPQKLVFNGEGAAFQQQIMDLPPSLPSKPTKLQAQILPQFKLTCPVDTEPAKLTPTKNNTRSPGRDGSSNGCFKANEGLDIDMHENPDIFGPKSVPLLTSTLLKQSLNSIKEDIDDAGIETVGKEGDSEKVIDQSNALGLGIISAASTTIKETASSQKTTSLTTDSSSSDSSSSDSSSSSSSSPSSSLSESAQQCTPKSTESEAIAAAESTTAAVSNSRDVSPKLNVSFTPVNAKDGGTPRNKAQTTAASSIEETHDYDSPGRDYMREFIKRSKPKRPLSATETGSPMAPVTKRKPLGPKSPNTDSPSQQPKRKHDKVAEAQGTPLKKIVQHVQKKQRSEEGSKLRKLLHAAAAPEDDKDETVQLDSVHVLEAAEADEDDDDMANRSPTRRSSRIRNQDRLPIIKSAIPTPIKIGRAGVGPGAGARSGPLNSTIRNEQQDLTNQTRMNTRRNKGGAEYPSQFLAKLAEQPEKEAEKEKEKEKEKEEEELLIQQDVRRRVEWKTPLVSHQEDPMAAKVKKGGIPRAKSSGIAKPVVTTRAKTVEQKQRTARLAEHFGMVRNGTPAKPQRMTRSRLQN